MSDARALLRAKRQEARVSHPLAAYTVAGQLRCVACGTNVKQASSWEGHVGSKAHRVNAAKLREERDRTAERAAREGKRKPEDVETARDPELESTVKKRKLSPKAIIEQSPPSTKQQTVARLPIDFFDDSGATPLPPVTNDEAPDTTVSAVVRASAQAASIAVDAEWEKFQETVLQASDVRDAYERATIFAEPVLTNEVLEGFPSLDGDATNVDSDLSASTMEKAGQREQQERELIMDRLVQEERAQEEADAKVSLLKLRLENLRERRHLAKAKRYSRNTYEHDNVCNS